MRLSALSLVPVREGQSHQEAIDVMLREAKLAEELGFERYWIAEHHNIKSYAIADTDEEAHYNNSTLVQLFLNEQSGNNICLQPPVAVDEIDG